MSLHVAIVVAFFVFIIVFPAESVQDPTGIVLGLVHIFELNNIPILLLYWLEFKLTSVLVPSFQGFLGF